MKNRRKTVIISPRTEASWWQLLDGLWRSLPTLQRYRLRATLRKHVLPVLCELEGTYLGEHFGAKPKLAGRSLNDIENDDVALEAALFLFDVALKEDLIVFARAVAESGEKRSDPGHGEVGSCGLALDQVKGIYARRAAELMLQKCGPEAAHHRQALEEIEIDDPTSLHKFRLLVNLHPTSVRELQKGLIGQLGRLLESDAAYLRVLHVLSPIGCLRALRYALRGDFFRILQWRPEFVSAVAEALDHGAKIMALGKTLLAIRDPAVVRALGTWPMVEVSVESETSCQPYNHRGRSKHLTRIAEVRQLLGPDFTRLLKCGATTVAEAGGWSNRQLERFQFYLSRLNPAALAVLAVLPFEYRLTVLDGLLSAYGGFLIDHTLARPDGLAVLECLVSEVQELIEEGKSPQIIDALIGSGELRDQPMIERLVKREAPSRQLGPVEWAQVI